MALASVEDQVLGAGLSTHSVRESPPGRTAVSGCRLFVSAHWLRSVGAMEPKRHRHGSYLRFFAMIATSVTVMFFLMYLNSYQILDHAWFSETRLFMTLIVGTAMIAVMLGYMLGMYESRRANVAIFGFAGLLLLTALWLVRSQATVSGVDYMEGMIPPRCPQGQGANRRHDLCGATTPLFQRHVGAAGTVDAAVHALDAHDLAGMRGELVAAVEGGAGNQSGPSCVLSPSAGRALARGPP